MVAPTLTLQLPSFASYPAWTVGDWRLILDWARAAEAAGADRIAVVDHVVNGAHGADQYSWGRYQVAPETAYLEPLTLLTAIAAVTTTVRLATRILIAPLRPAALLAKTAATLDVICDGRLDLGVGTGWQREEYEAEGLDFERRGSLLTDTMAACRALWSQLPASFAAPDLSFAGIYCAPPPVQERIPVWFGGTLHPANVDRLARLGDGWIPIMDATLADLGAGAALLSEVAAEHHREPFGVQAVLPVVAGPDGKADIARAMAAIPELVGAGATDILVNVAASCPDHRQAIAVIAEIGDRFAQAS